MAVRTTSDHEADAPTGILLALAANGAFTPMDASIKVLGGRYHVVQVVFFNAVFAFATVSAIAALRGRLAGARSPQGRLHLLRWAIGLPGGLAIFWAYPRMPLADAYAILFAAPLFMTALSVPVLAERVGWQGALVILAALNLVVCGSVHFFVPARLGSPLGGPGSTPRPAPTTVHAAARGRPFWGILVAVVANAMLFAAVTFHLVPLLGERGVPLPSIVAAAALVGPAQVGARALLLASEGRLSLRASALLAATLPLLGTAVLAAVRPGSWLIWLFPLFYGAGNGMLTIVRATAIVELLSRSSFGAVNGAIALPALAGTALAPVAAAHLWKISGGYESVLAALLGLAVATLAGFWWATTKARPR